MFQLNRVAVAINDLLGAKSWPRNPSAADETVKFVYDLRNEQLAARAQVINASGSVTGKGITTAFSTAVTVPTDETWLVRYMSGWMSGDLPALNELAFQCALSIPTSAGGGFQTLVGPECPRLFINPQRPAVGWEPPQIWLPPTSYLCVNTTAYTTGPFTVALSAVVVKAKI